MGGSKKILVIGDAHAKAFWEETRTKREFVPWDIANARFDALGAFIVHHKPDVIVQIGDLYDYKSLSSYDKGKRSAELQRLEFDVEAAQDALERIEKPIEVHNAPIKNESKNRQRYKPRKVLLLGNHEERYLRLVNDQPLFATDGLEEPYLQADQAGFHKRGWEVYPFLQDVVIQDIHFKHYWTSGIMGRPIGGVNPAASMLNKIKKSCVGGHSHLLSYHSEANDALGRIHALVAGCFFGFNESYAGPANQMWWRGLCMLHHAQDGDYDLELHRYGRVMHEFGNGEVAY